LFLRLLVVNYSTNEFGNKTSWFWFLVKRLVVYLLIVG